MGMDVAEEVEWTSNIQPSPVKERTTFMGMSQAAGQLGHSTTEGRANSRWYVK